MRAFIAIELPEEIKDALAALQEELKVSRADVKWVGPKNIHLTLKFLGEIDDKQLDKISRIIDDTAERRNKFLVRISSLGAFPKIDSPRVIWIGISSGDEETRAIAEELEEEIAKTGIPEEDRAFSSHITIGRTRSALNREKLVEYLKDNAELKERNLEFYAGKITLFKSTLTPKGPIYEALKEANLKNT
ncbi:MAG: RNA 2',3'-cyclic phosphodiesterase [Candidatus Omnitrophota bacterium]